MKKRTSPKNRPAFILCIAGIVLGFIGQAVLPTAVVWMSLNKVNDCLAAEPACSLDTEQTIIHISTALSYFAAVLFTVGLVWLAINYSKRQK